MKYRLEFKIIAIFSVIIFLIMGSYFIAFRAIYVRHEFKLMGEEGINTLQTIKSATLALIDTADNYSKIILSDEEIQEVLNTGNIYSHFSNQSKVTKRIYNLLQFEENIKSVYFIDQANQIFTVGDKHNLKKQLQDIKAVSWYEDLMKQNGRYLLSFGDESVSSQKIEDQVYLLRVFKDLERFSYLGIVAVGINVSAFQKSYTEILNRESGEEIIFLDEQNQIICQDGQALLTEDRMKQLVEDLEQSTDGELITRISKDKKNYLLTGISLPDHGWKILRILPMDIKQDSLEMMTVNIAMILLSGIFILMGTVLVSRMMTIPIQKILFSMKQAEKGEFIKVRDNSLLHEFRYLFTGYNRMIEKIEQLLKETIEEQQTIRRIELNEIQEQMKPHFLYNTLDAIEALAMMGEKEKVCEIIEALGDFYRKSVSKGRNMLTLEEELKIVKDYIQIMKIRFEDLFTETFSIDERCNHYLIPKLTLQPIVENAIHHGLRGKEEGGHLWIEVSIHEEWLIISVTDDGCGISKEKLEELTQPFKEPKEKGFGLTGTIERMKLVYGKHFKYAIRSEQNEGTNVTLWIQIEALEVY